MGFPGQRFIIEPGHGDPDHYCSREGDRTRSEQRGDGKMRGYRISRMMKWAEAMGECEWRMLARGRKEKRSDRINHQPTDNWTSCTRGTVAALWKVTLWFAINSKRKNEDLVPFWINSRNVIPDKVVMILLGSGNHCDHLTRAMAPFSGERMFRSEKQKIRPGGRPGYGALLWNPSERHSKGLCDAFESY